MILPRLPGFLSFWRRAHWGEWRLAARVTIAGLLAYILAEAFKLPQSFWAVLTALLVTQASVGASIKAMTDRLMGTISGAIWGVIVSLSIPHPDAIGMGWALAVTIMPLSLVAAVSPAYRIAPVTAIILLLASTGQHMGTLEAALDRVLEIGVGCAIAMVVSLVVLPGRAHNLLTEAAREYLGSIADQLVLLLQGLSEPHDDAAVSRLHQRIRRNLATAEGVAVEAARERSSHLTGAPDPEPLVRMLRRLRHDLVLLARATAVQIPAAAADRIAAPVANVTTAMSAFLRAAGAALVNRQSPPSVEQIRAAMSVHEAAMTSLRADGITRPLSDGSVGQLFALAFALEELATDLDDLAANIATYCR